MKYSDNKIDKLINGILNAKGRLESVTCPRDAGLSKFGNCDNITCAECWYKALEEDDNYEQ